MTTAEAIHSETACGGTLRRIIVDVPPGNIYNCDVLDSLQAEIDGVQHDHEVRLITIEGAGKHFSYGASIDEHIKSRINDVLPRLRRLILTIAQSGAPVAGLVQGCCYGGAAEAVLACHFIFAASDLRFGLPEIKLGVFPPYASAMLSRMTAQSCADRMILSGEPFGAVELKDCGIAHAITPPGELYKYVLAWFDRTLKNYSASSLRFAVRASRRRFLHRLDENLLHHEQVYVRELMETRDANEGIAAFIEKRPPVWRCEK